MLFQECDALIMTKLVRQLNSQDADFSAALKKLLAFDAADDAAIDLTAAKILADVKKRGDQAVLEYTQQFDRLPKEQASSIKALEITKVELLAALESLPKDQRTALEAAAARVKSYHERQKIESGCHSWDYADEDGTRLGQKVTPLDRAGLYVPGGKAAYPSSVLMNAIPA
jgi:histidinol dehydrogenase